MVVGMLSDIRHADICELVQLWAINRVLRERGVMPLVLPCPETEGSLPEFAMEQFTVCNAGQRALEKYGIYRQIGGFVTADAGLAAEQEAEGEHLEASEKVEEASEHEDSCSASSVSAGARKKRSGKRKPVFLEHPLLLLQQVRYHGISVKPEAGGKYAFFDVRAWKGDRRAAAERLCRERGLRMIVRTDAGCGQDAAGQSRGGVAAEEVVCRRPEEYVGLIWQAEAVVTDTYFGAVMAAIHEKEFAVFPPEEKQEAEKLRALLKELCLSEHLSEDGGLSGCLHTEKLTEFRRALHALRDRQLEQLERCLAFEEEDMLVKCPVRLPASQCCACGACEAVCPENAIRMEADRHGYYYPVVDRELCNDCGWCAEACVKKSRRQLVQYADATLPEIYAAEALDGKGAYSAYSGIFRELVHFVITQRQGIIFGTRLNERHEPVLAWTENEEEAAEFAEQRFLMSRTREGFRRIKELLDQDRFVMFAGIPCECAGLKGYLKRSYPKLFVCEFLCRGAVTEEAFRQYVALLEESGKSALTGIHFGEFPAADAASSRVILTSYADGSQRRRKYANSAYYQLMEQQALANEACTNCSYNGKKRVGDITLGEFRRMSFGEVPEEWRGRAVVIANTEKGSRVFSYISERLKAEQTDYDTLFRYQHRKTAALVRERSELLARLAKKDLRGILKAYARQEK